MSSCSCENARVVEQSCCKFADQNVVNGPVQILHLGLPRGKRRFQQREGGTTEIHVHASFKRDDGNFLFRLADVEAVPSVVFLFLREKGDFNKKGKLLNVCQRKNLR